MQVLLLFAHADDESLGAGGLVQKLLAKDHQIQLLIVSDGIVAMRDGAPDNRQALQSACTILGIQDVQCLDFKDQQFDQYPVSQIANAVSAHLKTAPDLIITHSPTDLNRDHRIVCEVAKIIGRPRQRPISILGCEIPCVSVWNGQPFPAQFYVDISQEIPKKIAAFSCYQNELRNFPDPYSAEGLENLARFRGMESGYKAAEAFQIIRWFENCQI